MSEDVLGRVAGQRVLLLEPFYGGSHRQLIDLLYKSVPECTLITLPASKWHWRARTSALHFSFQIPNDHGFSVLFASSVLNLAELVALRPDLAGIRKVLYFHENQLVYPVRKHQDRDFQYGYNQILSCLVADAIVFNSSYNQESFLTSIESFLKLMPNRPRGLAEKIRPKCQVLYFPIDFPTTLLNATPECTEAVDNSSETNPSNSAPHRHVSNHILDQSARTPDCTLARCKHHSCRCDISNSANRLTCSKDGNRIVQPRPRITSEENSGLEEDEVNEGLEKKLNDISLDKQKDSHISSSHSAGVANEGIALQNPKEIESMFKVSLRNHEDVVNSTKEKDDDGNMKLDTLPLPSSVVEQHANMSCHVTEKEPLINAPDGGTCCHGNRDCLRGNESGKEDGKVQRSRMRPLHILWPHRWEHDKNPEQFFTTLFQLCDEGCNFHLSVLGENYLQTPPIFKEAEVKLKDHIVNWGFLPSKDHYYQVLSEADVVVSTANHEFFGVAMLEATHFHCYPLCPERLVYPEIFPAEHLYRTSTQLLKKLRRFCRIPDLVKGHKFQGDLSKYSWLTLEPSYLKLLL